MRHDRYMVFGQYSHEQSKHAISGHRTLAGAWRAASREHDSLGGCAGGDLLAWAYERPTPAELVRAKDAGADIEYVDAQPYVRCDYFDGHSVEFAGGAIVATVRE